MRSLRSVRSAGPKIGSLRLIDYESAGLGDPAWDLGCVIASYLHSWLWSMPDPGTATAEGLVARAALSEQDLREAAGAFWHAYLRRRAYGAGEAAALLGAAVRYAVARLLWIAFEAGAAWGEPSPRTMLALQLAHNLARRPMEGAGRLLGLSPA